MQTVLRLINILVDLLQGLLSRRAQVKRNEDVNAIRNDPAGEFINEFGVLPNKPTEPPAMPGSQAGAEVGNKEQ
jgi:hypothetical protein